MIWYDVSGLYNWKGSFTGIQRIVYNLGENLHKGNKAKFFIFKHGNFTEVAFSELEHRLTEHNIKGNINDTKNSTGKKVSLSLIRHYGSLFAKSLVLNTKIERPIRSIYGQVKNLNRLTEKGKGVFHYHGPFKLGDTVVVVDGNWQFPNFDISIVAAKKHYGFKLVHFVHDIVAIKNPALANKGADKIIGDYFGTILPQTDQIIAISKSTKKDIKEFLSARSIRHPAIDTILLGSDMTSQIEPKKPSFHTGERFVLSVSTIEVRKNHLLLYYAYKQAIVEGIDLPNLIVVGKKGWMAEEAYNLLTKDPEVKNKVTVVSGVTDHELEWLYQNCLFTVFPSFYEGWGLPIGESLARGKCCISSNTSSMPEVGGDLALFVSPYEPKTMMEMIYKLANDQSYRSEIEKKIKSNYKANPWTSTYEDMLKILKTV